MVVRAVKLLGCLPKGRVTKKDLKGTISTTITSLELRILCLFRFLMAFWGKILGMEPTQELHRKVQKVNA